MRVHGGIGAEGANETPFHIINGVQYVSIKAAVLGKPGFLSGVSFHPWKSLHDHVCFHDVNC